MDNRIPSADDLTDILANLQILVGLSGPLAPPGYRRALEAGEPWPKFLDMDLANIALEAEYILTTLPPHPQGDTVILVEGWAEDVKFALYQARSALRALLAKWGLRRIAEWEEFDPGDGAPLDAALTIGEDLHGDLLWSHRILALYLKDGGPPDPGDEPELEPEVFRRLAAEMRADRLDVPAALVELLADHESAPIDEEYYRRVHGGHVSPSAVRLNASKATEEVQSRGAPFRYRGLVRTVKRVRVT